ncbi:hypothetical protein METBIDRAFT_133973 [Metschnikowia bicuspidata var. bicuspidata NRRL YB-4993]|uniref:Chitin synthase export chaperone n=1 Tax=Metschnikowia bicuspidata var. bicuspidata NRRL YB-4993 TaxID=869754 RepID=A0A1A0HKC7_9ASCO|nr:hypothetical protein METBIDRAFT_133973 [Metschnikowia bicuspidata var. bicuspidata NRRL YB-4993]OBA24475.1 hypothetical protein METBIDRAFT_133973 [Metschnikowia bicuspidata var. bicuspidata NRRL YB-4993]
MGFGSFEAICGKTGLPICSVVAPIAEKGSTYFSTGVVPDCYSRSVELANTMIFQIGNAFIHIGTLIILLIIIFNVRSKYTAIGRSEMLSFFYLYMALTISSLVVDCGVSPPGSESYPYFVALQLGIVSAVCICLLYNGVLCFQFWEDGSRTSRFGLYLICIVWFVINFVLALATFQSWGSLSNSDTTGVFVVTYILNAIILVTYVISQLILVFFALDSYWYLGAIVLFSFFFVVGQLLVYVFNYQICSRLTHYVDGIFFGTLCNTFAIMMVYKFWDMITSEDLEFSVANVERGVTPFGDNHEKSQSQYFN